jgi:hypothetical protein
MGETWHSPTSPKIKDKVMVVLALYICDKGSYKLFMSWH